MAKRAVPPSVKTGKPVLGSVPRGWGRESYGDLFNVIERPIKMTDDDLYRLVTAKRSRGGIVEREILRGRDIKTKGAYKLKAGDFLISNRQIVHGACGIVPSNLEGSIVSGEYTVLNPKNGTSLEWLRHFSHTLFFQQSCFHSSIGVDVEKMVFKLDRWLKTPVNVPPPAEQNKIAEILGCWDKAINLVGSLIEEKTRLKNELAKRFFSIVGGEKVRRVNLGQIAKLTAGGTPSTSIPEYWNGNVPWMSSGEVHKKRVRNVDGRISEEGLKNSSAKLVPAGTVLIALAGQGKTRGTVAIAETELSTNQSVAAVLPNRNEVIPDYLFHNLDSRYVELRNLSMGQGRAGLNLTILESIVIFLPEKKEQESVVAVLNCIDTNITLLNQLQSALSEQKLGLMQQLLTGKKRVKV